MIINLVFSPLNNLRLYNVKEYDFPLLIENLERYIIFIHENKNTFSVVLSLLLSE